MRQTRQARPRLNKANHSSNQLIFWCSAEAGRVQQSDTSVSSAKMNRPGKAHSLYLFFSSQPPEQHLQPHLHTEELARQSEYAWKIRGRWATLAHKENWEREDFEEVEEKEAYSLRGLV